MKTRRSLKLGMLIAMLVLAALACSLPGSGAATEVPPVPTDVPLEPTTAIEPTSVPPTEVEPTEAPEVEPTGEQPDDSSPPEEAPPLEILMVNGFQNTFGTWNVVGLVKNNTDRDISSVELEIEMFDANDTSLLVEITTADLFNLSPGEISPFSIVIFEDLPDADHFLATVVGNSTANLERAFLTIQNTRMVQDDFGDTHITGQFVNDNEFPVFINSLAAATFDINGQIQTADDYAVSIRYLDPGESGPFRFSITSPEVGAENIESFEVYLDAEVEEPVSHFSLALSDAYDYLDTNESFHLVGEITNNSDVSLNIHLIAGIYAADGTVLDASSVDVPIGALIPGETSPYDFYSWGPMSWVQGLYTSADNYTIVVDAYWTWETSTEPVTLSTQNDANEFDEFGGRFTGEVVNNSGGPVEFITILVLMRDKATGRVVGTNVDFIFDEIADGGTGTYEVYMDIPEGFDSASADYVIIVRGERP